MFFQLVMWPRYVSRLVDVSWLQVFRNVWGPVFLCAVPFAAASYGVEILFPVHHMVMFFLQYRGFVTHFGDSNRPDHSR
jgi:hypothetical protein